MSLEFQIVTSKKKLK